MLVYNYFCTYYVPVSTYCGIFSLCPVFVIVFPLPRILKHSDEFPIDFIAVIVSFIIECTDAEVAIPTVGRSYIYFKVFVHQYTHGTLVSSLSYSVTTLYYNMLYIYLTSVGLTARVSVFIPFVALNTITATAVIVYLNIECTDSGVVKTTSGLSYIHFMVVFHQCTFVSFFSSRRFTANKLFITLTLVGLLQRVTVFTQLASLYTLTATGIGSFSQMSLKSFSPATVFSVASYILLSSRKDFSERRGLYYFVFFPLLFLSSFSVFLGIAFFIFLEYENGLMVIFLSSFSPFFLLWLGVCVLLFHILLFLSTSVYLRIHYARPA